MFLSAGVLFGKLATRETSFSLAEELPEGREFATLCLLQGHASGWRRAFTASLPKARS